MTIGWRTTSIRGDRPAAFIETRFLDTAATAEAYHRRADPVDEDVIAAHELRLTSILSNVADAVDRAWLQRKLRHAYGPSFADRLTALWLRTEPVLGAWLDSGAKFSHRVADARNLLVHRDPRSKAPAPTGRDLFDMQEDVGLVVLICLYQDLGFGNQRIRAMLGRTTRWRLLEFRKSGWRN